MVSTFATLTVTGPTHTLVTHSTTVIPTSIVFMSNARDIVWSLVLTYGAITALRALMAQRSLLRGNDAITIGGIAASAWFLAHPQFVEYLEDLELDNVAALTALVVALIVLLRDEWGDWLGTYPTFTGWSYAGKRWDDTGADDGFA